MTLRITDLYEQMAGQHQGTGYITLGTNQYPSLLTLYFGLQGRPTREEAEVIARRLIAGGSLVEVLA